MSTPFPPPSDGSERVRFGVRLAEVEHSQLKLIAWFWNEVDRAKGLRRRTKWKIHTVIEWFVRAQLDGFWHQIGDTGGTLEERKERLKKIVAEVAAEQKAKDEQTKKSKK